MHSSPTPPAITLLSFTDFAEPCSDPYVKIAYRSSTRHFTNKTTTVKKVRNFVGGVDWPSVS